MAVIFGVNRNILGIIYLWNIVILEISYGIHWLALSKSNNSSACNIGRQNKWLTKTQSRLCLESYQPLADAADLTMSTCQEMFKYRRWNCSNVKSAPIFTPDLTTGTREQGIVYALSSAAMMYTLSRSCAQGNMKNCPCINKPETLTVLPTKAAQSLMLDKKIKTPFSLSQFKWGGCTDNTKWAMKMTRSFVDSPYKKMNETNLHNGSQKSLMIGYMNRHNNKIGRKNVQNSLSINCQCHGISGSCSMRTCWKALPGFFNEHTLLNHFMNQYRNATEFSLLKMTTDLNLKNKIIYITKSPDYCNKDQRTGSQGTKGRQCNETTSIQESQNSCKNMCCGRGYVSNNITNEERCGCKYYWCCYVKCKKCFVNIKINECL